MPRPTGIAGFRAEALYITTRFQRLPGPGRTVGCVAEPALNHAGPKLGDQELEFLDGIHPTLGFGALGARVAQDDQGKVIMLSNLAGWAAPVCNR